MEVYNYIISMPTHGKLKENEEMIVLFSKKEMIVFKKSHERESHNLIPVVAWIGL